MARPLRIQYPGAFYHATSRGSERRVIFRSSNDRGKFLSCLESVTERYGAIFHAYCLMPNHYHLLVASWLKRESILSYFGKAKSARIRRYRAFVYYATELGGGSIVIHK